TAAGAIAVIPIHYDLIAVRIGGSDSEEHRLTDGGGGRPGVQLSVDNRRLIGDEYHGTADNGRAGFGVGEDRGSSVPAGLRIHVAFDRATGAIAVIICDVQRVSGR